MWTFFIVAGVLALAANITFYLCVISKESKKITESGIRQIDIYSGKIVDELDDK